MDRVHAGLDRHPDDVLDVEIGLDRPLAAPDLVGLVRLEAVQRQLVLFGEDGDGPQSKLVGGPEDANRDFGPVGDKDLGNGHRLTHPFTRDRTCAPQQ